MTLHATVPPGADADIDLDLSRRLFVETMRAASVEDLTSAIRTACKQGHGHWQDPTPASSHARPATHLFEIAFLRLTAIGTTPEEAARNWRRAALNQIEEAA